MKKLLIALLAIIAIFTLTACGDKEDDEESSRDRTRTTEKEKRKNEKIKEEEKKDNEEDRKKDREETITDDDEIPDIDDEDNKPIDNEKVVVEKVINCEGCVYAYFTDERTFGSTVSDSEYTTDVNNLKTPGGKQRHNFFGFVLTNNKITRAYSCILKDNNIYCLEGTTAGQHHSSNIGVLNQVFKSDQCKTISDGHTYTCTDGSYNGDTKTNGYASMHYETSCAILGQTNDNVKMRCA